VLKGSYRQLEKFVGFFGEVFWVQVWVDLIYVVENYGQGGSRHCLWVIAGAKLTEMP
jgi:hypothetical protein